MSGAGGGGGGAVAAWTRTLSNVAVARRVASWLETASPTYALAAIVNALWPTNVQLTPSIDWKAEIVFARRSSLTHAGAAPNVPAVLTDNPPAAVLRWNAIPLPGDTSMKACAESAVNRSRTMTPALTHACTYSTDATRATISTSPVIGCQT